MKDESSLTARYLRGDAEIKEPKQRRAVQKRQLSIQGASEHNFKSIDVVVPLDMLVCVTGVSGSGKSTLIHDCIYAGLKKQRGEWQGHVGAFHKLDGTQLDRRRNPRRSISDWPHTALESGHLHKGLRRHSRSVFQHERGAVAWL